LDASQIWQLGDVARYASSFVKRQQLGSSNQPSRGCEATARIYSGGSCNSEIQTTFLLGHWQQKRGISYALAYSPRHHACCDGFRRVFLASPGGCSHPASTPAQI